MTALLGIDIGTTGAKALIISERGEVLAAVTTEYPLLAPRPLWSEQEPRTWWEGTQQSIRAALQQASARLGSGLPGIAAIGLTGQMHGLVLLDSTGEPVRPCILWNDQRSSAECEEIERRLSHSIGRDSPSPSGRGAGGEGRAGVRGGPRAADGLSASGSESGHSRLIAITGKPVLPNFTAPKILWVRNHEPDVFRRAAHMLLPKDYVRYCMSGVLASDVADASGTSLFDVGHRRWSDEMIEALEIPRRLLPDVFESAVVCSRVSRAAAEVMGLGSGGEGTPIVAGAGDQAAEAVGLGIVCDGEVSVTIGTSGVVFLACDSYRFDSEGQLHSYCHAMPGKYHQMGVMLAAGGSLRWYRDTLCTAEVERAHSLSLRERAGVRADRGTAPPEKAVDPYDLLMAEAAKVPPGCEGLFFLPYLSGERSPHADPDARGAFIGLTLRHTKAHMTRAVVEGITFGLLDSLNLARQIAGKPIRSVRISGGGAKAPGWRQIMADIFGAEVVTVNATQGAAFGAALLAGVGAGSFTTVRDACAKVVRETSRTSPGPQAGNYPKFYKRYRALYPALRGEFKAI